MALPFVAAASYIGGQLATHFVSSMVSAAIRPADRSANYLANRGMPNLLPSPDVYTQLYHAGKITSDTLATSLRHHGIQCSTGGFPFGPDKAWWAAINLQRAKPGAGDVLDLFLRDKIDLDDAKSRLHELGFSRSAERDLLLDRETQPDLGLIRQLHWRGEISTARADQMMRQLGFVSEDIRTQFIGMDIPHNTGDILQWYTRGIYSRDECLEMIQRQGVREETERTSILKLSEIIPGPADLVRFVVKDVFDETLVRELGLDDEYDQQKQRYEFWCSAQGLKTMDLPGNPDSRPINWPQMYYRANWSYMSPTQSYQALHRLRPDRVHLFDELVPGLRPFTLSNMNAILKASDYPESQRGWLVATSYNTMTRTDLRRMYDIGVLGDKSPDVPGPYATNEDRAKKSPAGRELFESFLDVGYIQEDAARLTLFTEVEYARRKFGQVVKGSRERIAEAYRIGVIGRDEAAIQLHRLTIESPDIRAGFDARGRPEQVAIALANTNVRSALSQIDYDAQLLRTKEQIAAVRKSFVRGVTTRAQAEGRLVHMGIDNQRIGPMLDLWEMQRSGSQRLLTVAQIVKLGRYGLIGEQEVERRLINLGFDPESVLRIRLLLNRDVALDLVKLQERTAKTEDQRRKALVAAAREAERQRQRAIQRLARTGSPSQLERWVVRGIIPPESMYQRLLKLEWPEGDARAKTIEAEQRRSERLGRRQ